MKNSLKILCFFFLMITYLSNIKSQEVTAIQKVKIEKEIDSLFIESIGWAENLDAKKLEEGVDDSFKAGFIMGGDYYFSFDSLMTVFKSRLQGLNNQKIMVQKKKITVLSTNIALVTASGEAIVLLNSGQSFSTKFFWSFVYKKINGKWKTIQSHQSNPR